MKVFSCVIDNSSNFSLDDSIRAQKDFSFLDKFFSSIEEKDFDYRGFRNRGEWLKNKLKNLVMLGEDRDEIEKRKSQLRDYYNKHPEALQEKGNNESEESFRRKLKEGKIDSELSNAISRRNNEEGYKAERGMKEVGKGIAALSPVLGIASMQGGSTEEMLSCWLIPVLCGALSASIGEIGSLLSKTTREAKKKVKDEIRKGKIIDKVQNQAKKYRAKLNAGNIVAFKQKYDETVEKAKEKPSKSLGIKIAAMGLAMKGL